MTEKKGISSKSAQLEATAAQRFSEEAQDYIEHPEGWGYWSLRRWGTKLIQTPKEHKALLVLLNQWEDAGVAISGTSRETIKVTVRIGGKDESKTFNPVKIQRKVSEYLWGGLRDIMNHPPQRSGIYMRAPPKRAKVIDFRFYEDGTSIFIKGYEKGRTVVVIGPRGSGKTYTVFAYVMPDAFKAGMRAVGNVPLVKDLGTDENGIPYYRYEETMSGTLKAICENWLEGLYTFRPYDEVATSQKRVRAASDTYQTQKDIWVLERKLHSMTVPILQLETDIPTELRGFADLVIRKPSAENARLNQLDLIAKGHTEWYVGTKGPEDRYPELNALGLPVPEIRTFAFGMFKVDVHHRKLWDFLIKKVRLRADKTSQAVEKTQVEAILEYVEEHGEELGKITNLERAYVYREIKNHNQFSWRKMEELTGTPQATIRFWFSKLEDAEERGEI